MVIGQFYCEINLIKNLKSRERTNEKRKSELSESIKQKEKIKRSKDRQMKAVERISVVIIFSKGYF